MMFLISIPIVFLVFKLIADYCDKHNIDIPETHTTLNNGDLYDK